MVIEVLYNGLFFGVFIEVEVIMVELVSELVLFMEMVCMVNFGIEVIMLVICLVCGYMSRNKIVKFEGCYYGYVDLLLVKVGLGVLIFGVLSLLGVLVNVVEYMFIVEYNNLDSVKEIFEVYGDDIVCIIVEFVVGNMNCIFFVEGFFEGFCVICD